MLIFFLLLSITEFFSYFSSSVRSIIFYSYIFIHLFLFIYFIVIPLLKIFGITPILTYTESSRIIGKYFPEIKDKLLNTLQLLDNSKSDNYELLNAAITRKTYELKPFKFHAAINIKINKKYLVYFLAPLSIIVFILFASPSLIKESTIRLVNYTETYTRPLPYELIIINDSLSVLQGEDLIIEVKVIGDVTPQHLYLDYGKIKLPFKKKSSISFEYSLKNLQKSFDFNLLTNDYKTESYKVDVILKPSILSFSTDIVYPKYLKKKNESIFNIGNITIPEGSKVRWKFKTFNTEFVQFNLNNENHNIISVNEHFEFENHFVNDTEYYITYSNSTVGYSDTLRYKVNVIKDEFPTINIQHFKDSLFDYQVYFTGNISDDYGFKDLVFNYHFVSDSTSISNHNTGKPISINLETNKHQFYYYFDFSTININPGEEIVYFFTVRDNDELHHYKSSDSRKFHYRKHTEKEIEEISNSISDNIKNNLENSIEKITEFKEELESLKRSLLNKNKLEWGDREKIDNLMNKHNELEKELQNVDDLQKEKSQYDEKVGEENESLLKMQKQLEELFDKIMTDEMKQQIQELQDLLEKFNNKQQMDQKLDQMKMSNDALEKQLERQLELFKNFELQQKLQNTLEKLNEMQKKQKDLSIKSENKLESNSEILEKQKELKDKFNNLEKDIEELIEKNNDLQEPYNLEDTKQDQQDVNKEMNNSIDQLQKNNNTKSSQSQNNSAQKMQQMQNKLNSMMNSMQQQSASEDLNKLRELLENIVKVSFDQEKLLNSFSNIRRDDPDYVKKIKEQRNIQEDIGMINDTLFKISKRQAQIEPVISKKLSEIEYNLEEAISSAEQRRIAGAKTRQQYVMTGLNDLALLLAESIEDMQQQMGMGMGKGKPSQSQPSQSQMPSLMQMQQQLNQQIQQLKDQMQNGQKSSQSQKSGQSTSEKLARLAAEQAAIRRKLQQLSEQYDSEGSFKLSKMLKEAADKMEQTENDLVNKVISRQTLNRQKEIESRMLESDKAERKQEKEKKRISEEAKSADFSNKKERFKYNSIDKKKEYELLKTVSPKLNNYYKQKVKQYFYNIEE